jgi:hypothetical protein
MCCAKLGAAHVLATEVDECTALTVRNVQLNELEDVVTVVPYYWGTQPCPVAAGALLPEVEPDGAPPPQAPCAIVFFTDLLYIAIRDSLEDELARTLRDVCCSHQHDAGPVSREKQNSSGNNSCLHSTHVKMRAMFAFEERALEEEAAFMARIAEGDDGLSCEEIDSNNFDLSVIQPEGEFAALLWEPPSMRFFWLQQK